MSIPPAVIHGRTVQGIAFRKDQKQAGIDAIVQLKVDIGRAGNVEHIKVLSGDKAFVQDAKDYVKAAKFGAMPDIPQLANTRREWEMEVAFFTPKN
jgi:outer membrane biosynthesis protein TonB